MRNKVFLAIFALLMGLNFLSAAQILVDDFTNGIADWIPTPSADGQTATGVINPMTGGPKGNFAEMSFNQEPNLTKYVMTSKCSDIITLAANNNMTLKFFSIWLKIDSSVNNDKYFSYGFVIDYPVSDLVWNFPMKITDNNTGQWKQITRDFKFQNTTDLLAFDTLKASGFTRGEAEKRGDPTTETLWKEFFPGKDENSGLKEMYMSLTYGTRIFATLNVSVDEIIISTDNAIESSSWGNIKSMFK